MRVSLSPTVVDLTDAAASDPVLTGGKASALARAATAGLPTLEGVVLTTAFSDDIDAGAAIADNPSIRRAFEAVGGRRRRLVARSSSVVEDQDNSSMAGQFESVIAIDGLEHLTTAVRRVLDSRALIGQGDQPMAVLIQPLLRPRIGGVLFGVDPVTGRSDRLAVSAVEGGPEPLVSGMVNGSRYLLDLDGAVIDADRGDGPSIGRRDLRRLARLARTVARVFGGPQDVEWAIDTDNDLWLLQSRPVTSEVRGIPYGPVYGPGPVAETFPEPLTKLEEDLWVPPLREGVEHAVRLTGAATDAELAASEVLVVVAGRVAIDLRLAGEIAPVPSLAGRLNPVPAVKRLRGAWRVGRLRSALPRLAENLLDRVDADLHAVPPVDELTSRQLIALLERGRVILRAVHAHEILMGMLTDTGPARMTGASVALRVLAEARRDGLDDDQILLKSPVVLALTSPAVSSSVTLPPDAIAPDIADVADDSGNDNGVLREALRLRARWLQELTGRAAWELGERLTASGELPSAESVRHLSLDALETIVTKRSVGLVHALGAAPRAFGEPLPACFQLSDLGRPIPMCRRGETGGGTGAGGGTGTGAVTHDTDDPPRGAVLVTTTLTPGLGPLLPRLAGIVAETGSVLSHLAILARESGVPIVVGYAGATDAFRDGDVIEVNGDDGGVTVRGDDTRAGAA